MEVRPVCTVRATLPFWRIVIAHSPDLSLLEAVVETFSPTNRVAYIECPPLNCFMTRHSHGDGATAGIKPGWLGHHREALPAPSIRRAVRPGLKR